MILFYLISFSTLVTKSELLGGIQKPCGSQGGGWGSKKFHKKHVYLYRQNHAGGGGVKKSQKGNHAFSGCPLILME